MNDLEKMIEKSKKESEKDLIETRKKFRATLIKRGKSPKEADAIISRIETAFQTVQKEVKK